MNTGSAARTGEAARWRRSAQQKRLHERLLAGWVDYLDRVAAQPSIDRHPTLRDAAAGTLTGTQLEQAAAELAARPRRAGRARDGRVRSCVERAARSRAPA